MSATHDLRPLLRQQLYATQAATDDLYDLGLPLCDPLTRLLAYPSFERVLVDALPEWSRRGVHVAIGDVDDLTAYVNRANAEDATHFGHLAGNACMVEVGRRTRDWAATHLAPWPFAACGTFGGDEVVIAVAGGDRTNWARIVRVLRDDLRAHCPCSMSFALATLSPCGVDRADADHAYRVLVSRVDAALFAEKARARAAGRAPEGELVDLGLVSLTSREKRPQC